jgi:hypothetical protein
VNLLSYQNPKELEEEPKTLKNYFAMNGKFMIKNALFNMCFSISDDQANNQKNIIIWGIWDNQNNLEFQLQDLADADFFKLKLPDFLNLKFVIDRVILWYKNTNQSFNCEIDANGYSKLKLGTESIQNKRQYYISYESDKIYKFKDLPIIGGTLSSDDGIGLGNLELRYVEKNIRTKLNLVLALGESKQSIPLQLGEENKENEIKLENSLSIENNAGLNQDIDKASKIKWFDINKSLKCLSFKRVGIELDESQVKLYLSAGFTIAILEVDFYELYVTIPFLQSSSVSFGLSGLSITLNKPPFMISGGLYKVSDPSKYGVKDLYNGELMLKIASFAFVALGSYGEMADGETTFFMYLMISYPIGGPPYFFVNGFALGFGINRGVNFPDIKKVSSFPLVAAVLGLNSNLSESSSPQKALDSLSDWIFPSTGSYFFTAGIKFLSFGIIQSFALLMVEFGNKFRLRLLGISTLALPANIDSTISPIVYAQLAVELVFDSDSGVFMVIGALTDEAYVLDKNCHITGGFGFCVWFEGDYKGDFLVTIGGCHHPDFKNIHYPELDRVGINWKISDNLKLVGGAYFALTPSCMMAGAEIDLTYESGNLKAWLSGNISMLLMWKPFRYDIKFYISLGASYTLNLWLIHKTFTLEIGAGLHIWGPDFSCEVTIEWYIISFTIGFGSGNSVVQKIDWDEFSQSFIPKENSKDSSKAKLYQSTNSNGNIPSCKVQITNGLKRCITLKDGNVCHMVSSDDFVLNVKSALPCTQLELNGVEQINQDMKLGIVPMGVSDFRSRLKTTFSYVPIQNLYDGETRHLKISPEEAKATWQSSDTTKKIFSENKNRDLFDYENNKNATEEKGIFTCAQIRDNVPAALYKTQEPSVRDSVIKDIPVGMEVSVKEVFNSFVLPAVDKFYQMSDLMASEKISVDGLEWKKLSVKHCIDYSKSDVFSEIKSTVNINSKEGGLLQDLAQLFKTRKIAKVNNLAIRPDLVFMSNPLVSSTGAVNKDE